MDSGTLEATPEWLTYGFAPVVWSAGGDLIDRSTYRTAQGVLNSPASIRALTIVQGWYRDGLVNPDVKHSFTSGRAPVSWVGHWMYDPYHAAFPNDLKIVPLPRFGAKPSSGMGSWQWGITSGATDGDAVWRFLSYLLQPAQVVQMTRANGAIPAVLSAIRRSARFAPGGPEHLYVQQLQDGVALPRPQTPAYPAISAAFATAFSAISQGQDVRQALDAAVREIDGNLAANHATGRRSPERDVRPPGTWSHPHPAARAAEGGHQADAARPAASVRASRLHQLHRLGGLARGQPAAGLPDRDPAVLRDGQGRRPAGGGAERGRAAAPAARRSG